MRIVNLLLQVFILRNRPQVSMVYKLINHHVGKTREEFVKHEPQASGL